MVINNFLYFIQMSMVNISYLLMTGMLNNYGVAVSAVSGIGLKINTFAGMLCWAVGQAVIIKLGCNIYFHCFCTNICRTNSCILWV